MSNPVYGCINVTVAIELYYSSEDVLWILKYLVFF